MHCLTEQINKEPQKEETMRKHCTWLSLVLLVAFCALAAPCIFSPVSAGEKQVEKLTLEQGQTPFVLVYEKNISTTVASIGQADHTCETIPMYILSRSEVTPQVNQPLQCPSNTMMVRNLSTLRPNTCHRPASFCFQHDFG